MRTLSARRTTVVAAVVVALVALGVSVAAMSRGPGVVNPVAVSELSEIERLAPPDTHQLVLTPGLGRDNQWWTTVTAFMSPMVRLDNLKPTADLGITHLGYSFSAADPALGSKQRYARMLYVETDSAEHAEKVRGWLSSSIGAALGNFTSTIRGHTVVLATPDVPLSSTLSKPGAGLGDAVVFRQDTAQRQAGSLMWEDWGAYVRAAGASGGKPAEYARFFQGATGFTKGSRWAGYATSPQVGWSGRFHSGGMDPKLVSATDVESVIHSFDTVLARNPQGQPSVIDPGAGALLRVAFYAKHPDLSGQQATMGSAGLAFKTQAEGDTAFSFEPSYWLAGTSRDGSARSEGLSLFAYSIKGDQVNLKVTVNAAIAKSRLADKTSVKTYAPPAPPPPGYRPVPPKTGPPRPSPISPPTR